MRYGRPFTLAYIDLDNFKMVNDSSGHAAGDQVLRVVVDTLKRNIRGSDVIARLGRDEFAVLFLESGKQNVRIIVEKLAGCVDHAMKKNGWPVTFSIGAMTFGRDFPRDLQEMITAADRLMYEAKARGCHFFT